MELTEEQIKEMSSRELIDTFKDAARRREIPAQSLLAKEVQKRGWNPQDLLKPS